jgi:hypothetical protein
MRRCMRGRWALGGVANRVLRVIFTCKAPPTLRCPPDVHMKTEASMASYLGREVCTVYAQALLRHFHILQPTRILRS